MTYAEAFSVLREPAAEDEITLLLETLGQAPASYLDFLRSTNGADGALIQPEMAVRLFSIQDSLQRNRGYMIQDSLPDLWMIGDDSGDYAFCFDRTSALTPDTWPVVQVPLGALSDDEQSPVAASFQDWQESSVTVLLLWTPVLPAWEPEFREVFIVLDSPGPSVSRIAGIVRQETGISPQAALALVRSERPVLLRGYYPRELQRIDDLREKLLQHGALATIRRIPL